jgi:nicotinamide mononucleotide transporter
VDPNSTTTLGATPGESLPNPRLWLGVKASEAALAAIISLLVLAASYLGWWSIAIPEAWGFVTGGICVWLVIREHLWNWPLGLANNAFFFVLFLRGRLYADMTLQILYFGLGIYGWLNWVFGGENRSALKISRTTRIEWLVLAAAVPLGTWVLREVLLRVNDAAPVWDSLTTVLSIAAQYLLCRKRFENWGFWIAADVIYVPLYLSRKLPLTAILYAVFLLMCLAGVRVWRRNMPEGEM